MEAPKKGLIVLVTGATGFFGTNLVKLLSDIPEIAEIRPHARKAPPNHYSRFKRDPEDGSVKWVGPDQNRNLSTHHFEPMDDAERILRGQDPDENIFYNNPKIKKFYTSDICTIRFLEDAMHGVDIVFHACGDTRWWDVINEEQRATNQLGASSVFQIAASSKVKVFVHTSTVDVLGKCECDDPKCHLRFCGNAHQEAKDAFLNIGYNYCDSKKRAEDRLLELSTCCSHEMHLVIMRPGAMIGPRDVTRKYGRIFEQLLNGEIFCWPEGSTSVCDVAEVAKAHIKAAMRHLRGQSQNFQEIFTCAGPSFTYEELFEAMRLRISEKNRPPRPNGICGLYRTMPKSLAVMYGYVCQWWSTYVSGNEPEVNPGMARYLSAKVRYCSEPAEKVLGYPVVRDADRSEFLAHVVDEAYQWYAKRGWI